MRPKTDSEIEAIRKSGSILKQVHDLIAQKLKPGMTGNEIDAMARAELKKMGAKPAFLGVPGGPGVPDFPATICISLNDAVVHGIPDDTPFKEGDIIGFDFGVVYDGMITDAARTLIVGNAKSKADEDLVKNTKRSLDEGINVIKNGARTGDIGAAVQKVLDENGLGIVRELVGHGVGHELHEAPEIPNYGFKGMGSVLKTGMTIAVEPMATQGDWRVVVDPDGWTIRSRDGSKSAHFEDTLLITEDGVEILTR